MSDVSKIDKLKADIEAVKQGLEELGRVRREVLASPLNDEASKLLNDIYGALWTEAYYDGENESTSKFAQPLADKLSRLNQILGFK